MESSFFNLPEDPNKLRQAIMDGLITLRHQRRTLNISGRLINLPLKGELIVIGDIHGDYDSLKTILEKTDFIQRVRDDESCYLLCLGDYIDRGPNQIEVMYSILRILDEYPNNVFLIRGNHEGPRDLRASPHDFPNQLRYHYGEAGSQLYSTFQRLFDNLYNAALIPKNALLLHGGIPTQAENLEDIAEAHITHPNTSHLTEILWNDPYSIQGSLPNPRGAGKLFGNNVTERFLDTIGVNILIRGHQSAENGYKIQDRIITLFSCKLPDYRNKKASFLQIDLDTPLNTDTITWFIKSF